MPGVLSPSEHLNYKASIRGTCSSITTSSRHFNGHHHSTEPLSPSKILDCRCRVIWEARAYSLIPANALELASCIAHVPELLHQLESCSESLVHSSSFAYLGPSLTPTSFHLAICSHSLAQPLLAVPITVSAEVTEYTATTSTPPIRHF